MESLGLRPAMAEQARAAAAIVKDFIIVICLLVVELLLFLFIITKPRLFNEPISEDMDLKELFQLYSIGTIPDINDITIKKTADQIITSPTNPRYPLI